MGNKDHGHFAFECIDRVGEMLRRLLVKITRRFIKDEDSGLFEECSGNGDSLFLSAR